MTDCKESRRLSEVLKHLMEDHEEYNTVPKLATALYDRQLVVVKQKEYPFDDGTEKRKNAIGSIIKKIREHLREDSTRTVQGEFLCAYADLFHCSVDYILGRTDIMTPNIDAQQICEKTGLSEKAVLKLMDDSMPQWLWHEVWSVLIESDLYESLPNDWFSFGGSLIFKARKEGAIAARSDLDVLNGMSEGMKEIQEKKVRELENDKHLYSEAAYGALYKMARDITEVLEKKKLSRDYLDDEKEEARQEAIEELMMLRQSY